MKFKLDENFGTRAQQLFRTAGHDVLTVRDQGLHGYSDHNLYEVCCAEQRCLVTLDLDFSDVTRFPPGKTGGIVIIRVPKNPSIALLEQLIHQFLKSLTQILSSFKLVSEQASCLPPNQVGVVLRLATEAGFSKARPSLC